MRNEEAYQNLRRFLGRSLLLGLEFLVAGDIIKTVAIEPTMDSVLVLALIVLVRTVLSLSLDVEIDGRWPWDADRLKLRQNEVALVARQRGVPDPSSSVQTVAERNPRTAGMAALISFPAEIP